MTDEEQKFLLEDQESSTEYFVEHVLPDNGEPSLDYKNLNTIILFDWNGCRPPPMKDLELGHCIYLLESKKGTSQNFEHYLINVTQINHVSEEPVLFYKNDKSSIESLDTALYSYLTKKLKPIKFNEYVKMAWNDPSELDDMTSDLKLAYSAKYNSSILDDMADGEGEYHEDVLFKIFCKTRKLIMSNVPLESGNLKF